MTRVDVGAEKDFAQGRARVVTFADKEVGVVRWGDDWYAVRNSCPDQGGPLCNGAVRLPLTAEAEEDHVRLELEEGPPVIACPWHHYEFDLRTGRERRGGRRAITYQVEREGGRVYLRAGRPE